jgi:hypothetical protein
MPGGGVKYMGTSDVSLQESRPEI